MSILQLLKDQELKPKVKQTKLEGVELYVKKLTYGEFIKLTEAGDLYTQLQALVCDSEGNRVFDDQTIDVLDRYPTDSLVKLLKEATDFNSLDHQIDDAKKN